MNKKRIIDLEGIILDECANRFLQAKSIAKTRYAYRTSLKRFVLFYGKPIETFIKEVELSREKNKSLPVTERKRYAEDTVRDWIKWLLEKGFSNNSTRQSIAIIQNLLKFYEMPLSLSFIELPSAKTIKQNDKHEWELSQIKAFVDSAEYLRDKAIIMCMFQSGLAVGDIVGLDYGDVRRELDNGKLPLMLHIYRKKTDVEFKTFFGADAVRYLKDYLKSRKDLKDDSPLFTKLGSEERINEASIQERAEVYADKLDFIEKNGGLNPARPHSLRAAFRSRLTNEVDSQLIEFWMGHEIGAEARAYLNMPSEEMRKLYANIEHLLTIEKTSRQEHEGLQQGSELEDQLVRRVTELEVQSAQYRKIAEENAKKNKETEDALNMAFSVIKKLEEQVTKLDAQLTDLLEQEEKQEILSKLNHKDQSA